MSEFKMDSDFSIQIKVAVYSANGAFIKQCDSTSLSDETISLIMIDVAKELEKRG
jgi:hypothetical protein